MNYKKIDRAFIKECDEVQFCGFYILDIKKLKDAGFEPTCFFVEDEEWKGQ